MKLKQFKQASDLEGQQVTLRGWIRTVRQQKNFTFVELNDGSSLSNVQILLEEHVPDYPSLIKTLSTGVAIEVQGKVVPSPAREGERELQASTLKVIGGADPETYPLQKKRHSFEFLRTIAHLRPRTNTLGAVARVRNALSFATHCFFQERGFLYLHTPILTASDCEGAGEMFQVTTLPLGNIPRREGNVDYEKDFFGRPAYLTVSGQLNGEIYACALSDVYTFGPTFRAENSNTSRHLAEFWMIEPEMAFADLEDDMACAEAYLKFIIQWVLERCPEEVAFFEKQISPGISERLQNVVREPFGRVTYTEAVTILERSEKSFEYPVRWGADLQSEHERYLAEEFFKKPVIVTDYPKGIKAFYMRLNDDQKTVAAMDILFPKIGEIVGGSQREERLQYLEKRMKECGLDPESYWWYLDLRRYGSVPHAGFGAGFERIVQFVTGMENIRDVIPFPRYPGKIDF